MLPEESGAIHNISRNVDIFEEEEPVELEVTKQEIAEWEKVLVALKAEMEEYIEELGL